MTEKLYAFILAFSLLGFFSCGTTNRNAKSNLDWDGVYTGIVPGADSSINVEITLKKDGSYNVSYQYIDKSDDAFVYTGTFTWKDKDTIELDNNEIPPYYLVGEKTLTQLNMAGEKITGVYAENYVLIKK
ncbi:MAG: copper resistance protein NlpE [Treponema sp.]|jgi:uncharacterized lipoprotein NlpE involved in copper resistance|nr:copper resistance protein NlpE [Treponema sp.]